MPGARTAGVTAYRLDLTVDETALVTGVYFTAPPATLNAVFGPSVTRNSALLELLAGTKEPTSGVVTVDEHDVHAEPAAMRSRIGIVTGYNRVHPQLTVEQALNYEAELRLPPDTSRDHRTRVAEQVLEELQLTPHRATRIARLSPEVRRCVSLAIELVTRPTLLVVDEPGAGLDPAQEAHVMSLLRRQADLGCVVVVATSTSTNHLNMCDQVLLLSADGKPAFVGPPIQIEGALGTADWSQALALVSEDSEAAHRAFRARQKTSAGFLPPTVVEPAPPPAELTVKRQIGLVARRQLRLLLAQPVFLLLMAVLPFALAGLTLLIPGDSGLDRPGPSSRNAHEALEILAALNIAAVIMGTALTIRDLVGDWRIFRRDQAVGLSTPAYVAAKIIVFGVAAAIQAAALTAVVVLVRGGPAHGAVVLGNADVELYASVAVTAIVSAIVGLALSSLGKSLIEVLPLVVPVILASLLFAGGLVKLVGTWGFDQLSWLVPAHWGFAASGVTVDLHRVDALAADAEMWTHYAGWWIFDMGMLVVFGAAWAGFVLFRLRQPEREPHATRQQPR
jgi:ABC-type multidrug transport system ATPase subunit